MKNRRSNNDNYNIMIKYNVDSNGDVNNVDDDFDFSDFSDDIMIF